MSERFRLNPNQFPEDQRKIIEAIEKIRGQGGEAYEGSTDLARRNPVKEDTAPLLSAYVQPGMRVFEMGTAYGFSTLHMALGRPESITSVEFEPHVAAEAQTTLQEAEVPAFVFPGTVQEAARRLSPEDKFDLVFIDHDKASYLPDFVALEPHLRPSALILADNVNDRRRECQDFVEYVSGRYNTVILPTQAGLLVAQGLRI